ncbi:MAG TPA: hypothetical protein VL242_35845, partial [Sorangium sp.]|nr:hypothetical protein [Sorangium sp.]
MRGKREEEKPPRRQERQERRRRRKFLGDPGAAGRFARGVVDGVLVHPFAVLSSPLLASLLTFLAGFFSLSPLFSLGVLGALGGFSSSLLALPAVLSSSH